MAIALAAVAMLALAPATAYGHTTTRIVLPSSITANLDTASSSWVFQVVKLQRKVSGSHYHNFTGTVKLYRQDYVTGKYSYIWDLLYVNNKLEGFPQPARYKLVYAGSSTKKPCTAYTTIWATVGMQLVPRTLVVDAAGGSLSSITLRYAVTWNTAALPNTPVVVTADSELQNLIPGGIDPRWDWVQFSRKIYTSGNVEFSYKVENAHLTANTLWTRAKAYVAATDNPYIKVPGYLVTVFPDPGN